MARGASQQTKNKMHHNCIYLNFKYFCRQFQSTHSCIFVYSEWSRSSFFCGQYWNKKINISVFAVPSWNHSWGTQGSQQSQKASLIFQRYMRCRIEFFSLFEKRRLLCQGLFVLLFWLVYTRHRWLDMYDTFTDEWAFHTTCMDIH